jgi:DMSO reductase family type II enzyme heme b subunit
MRALLAVGLLFACASLVAAQQPHPGKAPYDKWCAACHGYDGAGDGDAAAYMLPRPRDFTRGIYQIRTTETGQLPTDADLRLVIDHGMPGTSMPGWRRLLSTSERNALVDYLKRFSAFFAQEAAPPPLRYGRQPRATDDGLAEGRRFYDEIECWRCHGQQGRGDGVSAPTQTDDDDMPIRPADLSAPWRFNGGHTVEDIFVRLLTGMDGTPMPSFADLIESGFMTEEQLWNVAQYVRSLGPERLPRVREVVRAHRVESLPTSVDDAAWDEAEPYYVPLVPQIIVRARWFAATVHEVWVQALHDGNDLALRLVWSDPSESPAAEWGEWRELVTAVMEPKDDGPPAEGELPDAIAVQFPRTIPTGLDRPFFLMGSAREPVYLWRWQSRPQVVTEMHARGMDRLEPLAIDRAPVTGEAVHEHGQWRLVLRRALVVSEPDAANGASSQRLDFATAQPIPFALFAWDGDNGEAGTRGAISTWYYIYLDEPSPPTVFATPILAMLLTAGLGVWAVRRAQRRAAQAGGAADSAADATPLVAASAGDEKMTG